MNQKALKWYLRQLHGIIAFNKPAGITSSQLCLTIKSDLIAKLKPSSAIEIDSMIKIGHGGILDRPATGVLSVGLGDGCKYLPVLLEGTKKYVVVGKLGEATDTYNSAGKVTDNKPYDHVTHEMLTAALSKFEGNIWQCPPVYSAIKHEGRRLADKARYGEEIPEEKLQPRKVSVSKLQCCHFDPPHFTLIVESGAGFYVRSLVHDLGITLGTCAHVTELIRTAHGLHTIDDAVTPYQYTPEEFLKLLKKHTKVYEHVIRVHRFRLKEMDRVNAYKEKKRNKNRTQEEAERDMYDRFM